MNILLFIFHLKIMNEKDDSSCSKELKNNINKPSISIFLLIITGLFIISFCTSFFSLKKGKKIKVILFFHEYFELFTSGIYFSFSITNYFWENIELNNYNIKDNSNNSYITFVHLFLGFGFIINYFCENILIKIQLKNNIFKSKYSSSFYSLDKNINNNINNKIDSFNSKFNNTESIISNESIDNSSPIENNIEKRYSTEEKNYFSIFNNNAESLEKEKDPIFSYDFSKKYINSKINNIYIYENLINKNKVNKVYEQIYNKENLQSLGLIILFNFHKIGQGLFIGINSYEITNFIFISSIIYFFVFIESFNLGYSLSEFQTKNSEIYLYLFIISLLYIISGLLGLMFKIILNEIIQIIIIYFIIGTFLNTSFNILDNYFYLFQNDKTKLKETEDKYYFCFFTLGFIIYILIFSIFR